MTRSICKISGDPYIPSYHEPKTSPKQTRGPVLDTVAKVLPETATSVTRGSEWSTGFSTSDLALCWWASGRHDGSSTWGPLTSVKLLDWDLGSLLWSFPYLAGVGVLRNEPVYGRFLFLSLSLSVQIKTKVKILTKFSKMCDILVYVKHQKLAWLICIMAYTYLKLPELIHNKGSKCLLVSIYLFSL